MFRPVNINDVRAALNDIATIERPQGDNEGAPINDPSVYDLLIPSDQHKVNAAYEKVREYVLHGDGEVNNRGVSTISKSGYRISIGQDQYDPMRTAGFVEAGGWTLEISDPK